MAPALEPPTSPSEAVTRVFWPVICEKKKASNYCKNPIEILT